MELNYTPEQLAWIKAKTSNHPRYESTRPCPKCEGTERYTANQGCVECARVRRGAKTKTTVTMDTTRFDRQVNRLEHFLTRSMRSMDRFEALLSHLEKASK